MSQLALVNTLVITDPLLVATIHSVRGLELELELEQVGGWSDLREKYYSPTGVGAGS